MKHHNENNTMFHILMKQIYILVYINISYILNTNTHTHRQECKFHTRTHTPWTWGDGICIHTIPLFRCLGDDAQSMNRPLRRNFLRQDSVHKSMPFHEFHTFKRFRDHDAFEVRLGVGGYVVHVGFIADFQMNGF